MGKSRMRLNTKKRNRVNRRTKKTKRVNRRTKKTKRANRRTKRKRGGQITYDQFEEDYYNGYLDVDGKKSLVRNYIEPGGPVLTIHTLENIENWSKMVELQQQKHVAEVNEARAEQAKNAADDSLRYIFNSSKFSINKSFPVSDIKRSLKRPGNITLKLNDDTPISLKGNEEEIDRLWYNLDPRGV
jgi:hypothetical protein